jgi:DNA mismatch repair ATPase MutS
MFYSILFPEGKQWNRHKLVKQPDCFKDTGLDKLSGLFESSAKELLDVFFTPLSDIRIIKYRQHILQDLSNERIRSSCTAFSDSINATALRMAAIRKSLVLSGKKNVCYVAEGTMLECAEEYCRAITMFSAESTSMQFKSAGLRDFSAYLKQYCNSQTFTNLYERVKRLRDGFNSIRYCMLINNGTIKIRTYEGQKDFTQQVLTLFERFRQGEVNDYRRKTEEEPYAGHVEEAVLHLLSGMYKRIFNDLNDFCTAYSDFEDSTLLRFADEIRFYLFWINLTAPLKAAGLQFCYPVIAENPAHLYARDCFDITLALKKNGSVVTNDFTLDDPERIIVITGPNQGGKTTFARTFAQLHWLAAIGLNVPGHSALLCLFDHILTHFEREEKISSLNGKLQDDLVRLHYLLEKATKHSIVIINEIFSSTTTADALLLGTKMMDMLTDRECPAVVVTFLDELALHGPETVSMMSLADPDDAAKRSFKIVRKPPDGLAYAVQLAEKHGLTYKKLYERLGQ